MKNVSHVVRMHLCLSCGACSAICPKSAISMVFSVSGLLFPLVNSKCNECGLCLKVCAGLGIAPISLDALRKYGQSGIVCCRVGRSLEDDIFSNSQSGGIVGGLLSYLINNKAISAALVATVLSGVPFKITSALITDRSGILKCQKSKYMPVSLLTEIKKLKKHNGVVAVVGLPCHLQGLALLEKHISWLKGKLFLKIGLICDRTLACSAAEFFSSFVSAPVVNVVYRDKKRPSYPGNIILTDFEGKLHVLDASVRIMMKDFFTPLRCRLCFDKFNSLADIVVGDPHGIKDFDKIGGESLFFSRTALGEKIASCAIEERFITGRKYDVSQAMSGQCPEAKIIELSANMSAWKQLGGQTPVCPITLSASDGLVVKRQKKLLLQSLKLASYTNKAKLLLDAKRWFYVKKFQQRVSLLIQKLRSAFKRILPWLSN